MAFTVIPALGAPGEGVVTPLERAAHALRELASCAEDAKDAADNAKYALRNGEPDAAEKALERLTGHLASQMGRLEDYRREAVDHLRAAIAAKAVR